jgi:hypothetical protein
MTAAISHNRSQRWFVGAFLFLALGVVQCLSVPTTNAIPSNLFLTDNGFLFWYRHSGERVVRLKDIQEAEKNPESRPSGQYPEGNWGESTNGFQLSLRLEKQVFTNGEPIIAVTLMRNITNQPLTYFYPIYIVAQKNGKPIKNKNNPGYIEITMLPDITVFPQTQREDYRNLNQLYDLSENGDYIFQAVCHHPQVSSRKVSILITNDVTVSGGPPLVDAPTPEQIEQAKQRLHFLKPDTTERQLRSTLGLKDSWFCLVTSGGPTSHYWTEEYMQCGHKLFLVSRETSEKQISDKIIRTWSLVSVSLDGTTWTAENGDDMADADRRKPRLEEIQRDFGVAVSIHDHWITIGTAGLITTNEMSQIKDKLHEVFGKDFTNYTVNYDIN